MLAIKLKLIGKQGQHSFRVLVQEKRAKLQGKFLDDLGWYNPHSNQLKVDQTKFKDWLAKGAIPTETVSKLMAAATDTSEVQSYKGRTRPKTKRKEKVASQKEAAPAAEVGTTPQADTAAPAEAASAEMPTPESTPVGEEAKANEA